MTAHVSRTVVRPGETILVWSRDGNLDPGSWSLRGSTVARPQWTHLARRGLIPGGWDTSLHHALIIPADLPPGDYQLYHGEAEQAALVVTPRTDTRFLFGAPHDPVPHTIYQNCEVAADLIDPHQDRPCVTFRRVTFRDTLVLCGHLPNVQFDDCTFIRSGIGFLGGPSAVIRCRFQDQPTLGGHPVQVLNGGAAVVDCTFDSTDNGIVVQTTYNPVNDCLFSGNWAVNQRATHNGCVGLGAEGRNAFRNNLILHWYYEGCGHALMIYDCPAGYNLVRHFESDGGRGIELTGLNGAAQLGTSFIEGEIRGGCVIDCGGRGLTNWHQVAMINPLPTRGASWEHATPPAAVPYYDGTAAPQLPRGLAVVAAAEAV